MKLSLHPVIIGQPLSLPEFVSLAAETGYDGVDVNARQIHALAQEQGLEDVASIFASAGVQPAGWGLPIQWREDETVFQAGLEELRELAATMASLDCRRTFTYFAPSTAGDPDEYRALLRDRLRAIGQVLAEYGVRLGLEWLGPRHIRASGTPVIWKMNQTLELIEEIGLSNIGLLFDVWHWFNAEDTLDDLRALRGDQIVHCHFNDAPDKPLDQQQDMHREIPGRGIIPLVDVLRVLQEIGYDGFLAVEIFNDELKAMPPAEAARLVKAACDEVLRQAFG